MISLLFSCSYPLSDVKFRWARGANAREQPKEDRGKVRELTFPLSPLGFSLALPFPDSLTPLKRKPLVWRRLYHRATLFCDSLTLNQAAYVKQEAQAPREERIRREGARGGEP